MMRSDPQSLTSAETGVFPVDVAALASADDYANLHANFLHWWHCSKECLLAGLKMYRRFDDDDITALYWALWFEALSEILANFEVPAEGSLTGFMASFEMSRLSGATVSKLSRLTNIPRETARRKLEQAAELRAIEHLDSGRFRLFALSADITPLFDNCIALSDTLLGAIKQPRTQQPDELPLPPWLFLMRAFFDVMLSIWSLRRGQTRGSSAVSVQVAIEILTVLKIYRRLSSRGTPTKLDPGTALSLAPECRASPYYVAQIAGIANLDALQVRRMCRNLAAQGRMKILSTDIVIPWSPADMSAGQLPAGLFSEGIREAGFRFIEASRTILVTPQVLRKPMSSHA